MLDQAEKLRQMVKKNSDPPPTSKQSAVIKAGSVHYNPPASRVVAVTSGKGGVGKTNLTINIALALADLGKKVLVIDADLGMANIEVILGYSPSYSLWNLINNEQLSLNDVVIDGPRGTKFISGGAGMYQLADLNQNQLQKIIEQIAMYDSWADFILIDTGAGIDRNVMSFVMSADEVVIITTPEPTAITDAYSIMKAYAANNGKAPLNLVVNRIIESGEGEAVTGKLAEVAARFLKLKITNIGNVYEDINLIKSVKQQKPLLLSYPSATSARCIEDIARRLLHTQNIPKPHGVKGFFSKLIRMLR